MSHTASHTPDTKRRLVWGALLAFFLIVTIISGGATIASATDLIATTPHTTNGLLGSTFFGVDPNSSRYITINRWLDATNGFSTKYDGINISNIFAGTGRTLIQGQMMVSGNFMWKLAMAATSIAAGFDVKQDLIFMTDSAMRSFLRIFTGGNGGPNLFAYVAIFSVVMILVGSLRRHQGREVLKRLISLAIIASIFGVASTQLLYAKGPAGKTAETYSAPTGTPGWAITKLTGALDSVSTMFSKGLVEVTDAENIWQGGGAMSCGLFIDGLTEQLKTGNQKVVNSVNDEERLQKHNRNYEMRVVVDRLWQQAGLKTWVASQFGSDNPYGDRAFCYLLDKRAEIPSAEIYLDWTRPDVMKGKVIPFKDGHKSHFYTATQDIAIYANATALASCDYIPKGQGDKKWSVYDGWEKFNDADLHKDRAWYDAAGKLDDKVKGEGAGGVPGGLKANHCKTWATGGSTALVPFHVQGNTHEVDRAASTANNKTQVADFLASFNGSKASGLSLSIMYGATSTAGVIPIVLFSVGKLVAEVGLFISIVMLWVVLVTSIFSRNPWGEKIAPVVKQTITMAVLSVGIGVAMSFMLVFSYAIASVGRMFPAFIALTIACLSPLIALVAMGWLWKKAFNAPSPFSLKGFNAWMKGSPLGMAAVAGGAGMMGARMADRMKQQGKEAGKDKALSALGLKDPEEKKRKSSMTPGGDRRDDSFGGSGDGAGPSEGSLAAARRELTAERDGKRSESLASTASARDTRRALRNTRRSNGKQVPSRVSAAWRDTKALTSLATSSPEGASLAATELKKRTTTSLTSGRRSLARSMGLDQATRDRIRFENPNSGWKRAGAYTGAVSAATASHLGRGAKTVGRGVASTARGTVSAGRSLNNAVRSDRAKEFGNAAKGAGKILGAGVAGSLVAGPIGGAAAMSMITGRMIRGQRRKEQAEVHDRAMQIERRTQSNKDDADQNAGKADQEQVRQVSAPQPEQEQPSEGGDDHGI